VLYVLRGAARALAYAHQCGIVHRDIKGGNLLVDRDGRVLVSDFGVALRAADITLTADGAVIGTPPFMSPEQCAGRRAGPQSDQYSLGIVAFQMLTGSLPFHADSLPGIMHHHFFTPVPDIGLVRDDAPEALTRILRRALSKEAGDRFPTTGEMLAAIEAIPFSDADRRDSERILQQLTQGDAVARISTRSLPALPETPTLAMNLRRAPPSRRHRLIVRGGGLAAAGLLAGAAVLWVGRASHRRGTIDAETVHPSAPPAAPGPSPQQASSSRAAPGGSGRLRMLTSPPDAEISVDSRRVGVGSVFDLAVAAGARRLRVRAPGYETFDTTIVIPAGGTVSLGRVALRTRGGGT
jgi:serine/threonine protein kinase